MIKNMFFLLIMIVFTTGCSTMLSPDKTSVYIDSEKEGQVFIVKDHKGIIIAKAVTPAVLKLDNKGDSTYTYLTRCEIKKEDSELNEWVIGNIITVSISGMLIDIANGYSNEPVDKVSLQDCDKVIAKKKQKLRRTQVCGNYASEYDNLVYHFNNTKNGRVMRNLKHTQDFLLKYCSSYVDISYYQKQESAINGIYKSHL